MILVLVEAKRNINIVMESNFFIPNCPSINYKLLIANAFGEVKVKTVFVLFKKK